ncbi:nitrate reductase subunit beta [Streptantibioticus cattleyicolor]|uniref:Nitrate reductase beta chain NarH3 n=1 Tax=Streptantibioticus cattleyicolor (strain ATCC 35852 / DSM 46488 / JCM 4925 / NBRC 14057 / NRRL 8057) TaxID=1003195 RepID=F8JKL9_STREN|nr:nitrate reductase subunit beta [Streptantibioticus cattleyicolor]AEW98489.1 nitrate reductase beta chain NarH3 [Streptantibioticus cattleyicolor NRRL 8057 = DSM 46488]CCB72453.1 nitrate reductase (beta subunit) [Streptantibioticus cattleyicolor NRRL 8057 = DSM 46488]
MRVMAQVAMVMNLDKCIGCHTCSVTCKQTWTNRAGTEYAWFNNVETRPGQGYPRRYEDQERFKGGWQLRHGRLVPRSGGRLRRLARIFANPELPSLDDYYQPWTYDYETLTTAPLGDDLPTAAPRSLIDGAPMAVTGGPNWDDDLGGGPEHTAADPLLERVGDQVRLEYEQAFMFYLPRICEHCLNPSCVAACPSGAMYKRVEDGIVLVDQDRCRGWRMCVSGCPYKKVYFNHRTGKAEKCTLCYPRIEAGAPTVCSETCVGRLRYLGVVLYDPDRVGEAASVPDEKQLYPAQLGCFLDPDDPKVARTAEECGIPHEWITAARRSPVYALIARHRVALPLHPEYRTMPMVWYIPPLSPIVDALAAGGHDGEDAGNLFGAIGSLRIPMAYLAELFTAGDTAPVEAALRRLAAMRAHMRRVNLGEPPDPSIAEGVAMTPGRIEEMYRLLALAKYDERYVIPTAYHATPGSALDTGCSLEHTGGPGMLEDTAPPRGRVNLLGWNGHGRPAGLFPARRPHGKGTTP